MSNKSLFLFILLTSALSVNAEPVVELSDLNMPSPSARFEAHDNKTAVQRLKRLLKNSNRVQAKLQFKMDQMADELQQMNGKFEKSDYDMSQLRKRQLELIESIDTLRQQGQAVPAAAASTNGKVGAANYQGNSQENQLELDLYQQAVNLYLDDQRQADAEKALTEFLRQYPVSDLTIQAHYWLAHLYLKQDKDVNAAKHFARVVATKHSHKRGDALMRMGEIAMRHNKKTVADNYYRQVLNDYPKTKIARLAKERLENKQTKTDQATKSVAAE